MIKRHQDRIRTGLAEIDRRLDGEHEEHFAHRKHFATAMSLLTRCAHLYEQSDDNGKRLANQAFFERIYIGEEDEQPDAVLAEPFAALAPTDFSHVAGSTEATRVDAMERCENKRSRVERLVSAWNQGVRADAESEVEADDPLIGASAEPSKRPRTRLTDSEVDAMRTARANGVSGTKLARQYGVHRGTVSAKTR